MKRFIFMKFGRTLLLAVVMVVGAVCVSYGDGGNPSELAGRWLLYADDLPSPMTMFSNGTFNIDKGLETWISNLPHEVELFSDGTGVLDGDGVTWKAENKRLRLLSPMRSLVADYNVSGYELILVYDERRSARFIKKENFGEYKKKKAEEAKEAAKEEANREAERLAKEAKAAKEKAKSEAESMWKKYDRIFEKISSYFTDSRDGQKYRSVKIGGKTWMARNLNYQTGNSWCYGGDDLNCDRYGRLYDWNTAKTACPAGWHLPSREEWKGLVSASGDGKAGIALKSKTDWPVTVDGKTFPGGGSDDYGFSALPGGSRFSGSFDNVGKLGFWWTATEKGSGAYRRRIDYDVNSVNENNRDKSDGYSVRCVKDE